MLGTRSRRFLAVVWVMAAFMLGAAKCGPNNSPSRFGVNGANDAADMDYMRQAGFKWVRFFVGWNGMQPDGPSLNAGSVAWLHQMVDLWHNRGFSVDLTITRKVPAWARDPNQAQPAKCTGEDKDERRPATPDIFRNFMFQLASEMKFTVAAYEVYNEPELACKWPGNEKDFRNLILKPGVEGVKAAQPGAIVLGPAIASGGYADWYTYTKNNTQYLAAPVDFLNVHAYGDLQAVDARLNGSSNFNRCMEAPYASHCIREYWVTEFGYSANTTAAGNNAVDVFKHCANHADCAKAFYFSSGYDGNGGPTYGLLNDANVPRAKYWPVYNYIRSKETPLP
jgi:hypothetical protein